VAAISSVVLIGSMFLAWYGLDIPAALGGHTNDAPTLNAFEGLERADVALLAAAILALIFAGLVLARVLASSPAPGLALLGAGLVALAVVIYRGHSRPVRPFFGGNVGTTLEFGWYVSLVAAAVIAIAGLLAYLAGPHITFESHEPDEGW
jgi:hypothetical protein